MAYKISVMPSAVADLEDYAEFIAKDSPRHAREWLSKAWQCIFSLSETPTRFARIPESDELQIELRALHHFSHRIIFRVKSEDQVVEVLRVYHSTRKPLTDSDI